MEGVVFSQQGRDWMGHEGKQGQYRTAPVSMVFRWEATKGEDVPHANIPVRRGLTSPPKMRGCTHPTWDKACFSQARKEEEERKEEEDL